MKHIIALSLTIVLSPQVSGKKKTLLSDNKKTHSKYERLENCADGISASELSETSTALTFKFGSSENA